MPSETDLYFPIGDARYEAQFIPRVTLTPIPSLWDTPPCASNPADAKFSTKPSARFLAAPAPGSVRLQPDLASSETAIHFDDGRGSFANAAAIERTWSSRPSWSGGPAGAGALDLSAGREGSVGSSSFIVSAMRRRFRSTSTTFTFTIAPALTTSRGSLTKAVASCETCTRPSWCTPMSTNAPKLATLVTTPFEHHARLRSPISCTPSLNEAVLNLDGIAARLLQLRQDVLHRRYTELRVGEVVRGEARSTGVRNQLAHRHAGLDTIRSTTGYASGCTAEASSGLLPS
jgi:hypothetical protein